MRTLAMGALVCCAWLACGTALAHEPIDVVHLKNGSRIRGVVIEQVMCESIRLRTADGSEFVFAVDQVERIATASVRHSDLPDWKQTSYPELGLAVGTPAALNWQAGLWRGPNGIRVSGSYWPGKETSEKLWGLQLNLMRKLSDTPRSRHVLGMVASASHTTDVDVKDADGAQALEPRVTKKESRAAVGLAYNYNWRGLFLELGLTVGSRGDDGPVRPIVQIGYMHRFAEAHRERD